MKERIVSYMKYIDDILESEEERDWQEEIEKHLIQIRFFAHERLVHLIVFALVAVCTVMSILAFVAVQELMLIPLIVMLFVLLIPYCAHYYLLENNVQRMYEQYDKMRNKIDPSFKRG